MNVSISGLKMAVRQLFWKHGLTVDENNLEQAVRAMGLRPPSDSQAGGDTATAQSRKGQAYGPQLIDLQNKDAVENRLKEVNPAAFADQPEDDFHFSSAGAGGGFKKS